MKINNKLETIDIKNVDKRAFLHYTNKNNLDSIIKKGLEPRIGNNADGFEIHEKVFYYWNNKFSNFNGVLD